MSTTYRQIPSLVYQRDVLPQPITALSFDPVSDILWSGTNSGHVCANYTPRGLRGVHYPVGGHYAVKKILATNTSVIACGVAPDSGIGAWGKGGINNWYFKPESQITTFSNKSSNDSTLAVSTAAPELILLSSQTGSVVRKAQVPSILTHLHFTASQTFLVSGDADGWIRLHDPRDPAPRSYGSNTVKAHLSAIQGMETTSTLLYTIGLGIRQGRPFPDPLVKIYDLRTLKSLPPVPFSTGPAFISRFANRPSTLAIVSNQGLVQIVDTANPTTSEFYQLDASSLISTVAISPTAAYMAFGDSDGAIHLLSAAEEDAMLPFNGFEGKPIDWADTPEPLPEINWTATTPLNSVGLSHYNSLLLSSWSSDFVPSNLYFPPPPKIPQQVLNSIKVNDTVAYAALPKELRGRRNVVATAPRKTGGRFRSGKAHYESEPVTPTYDYNPDNIPKCYRKVEIEYSKFGVEDFDFGFYNRTHFSGLETHILNSYTNALVQVMHHIMPIRKLTKSHITTDCPREHCLLCELGFATRMLEDAHGTNCQSSNFCKTVGVLAQMNNAIELIDYGRESTDLSYSHKIQLFHRFLIDHLSSEGNSFPHNPNILPDNGITDPLSPAPAPVTQLLGIDAKNVIVCSSCRAVREKENMTHLTEMTYPVRKTQMNDPAHETDFASILRNSLLRPTTHKATCQTCKQFATFESRRSIRTRDLPPVLAVNAAVHGEETHRFWRDHRRQTFLKANVELRGQAEGMDDPETAVYELRAIVVQVVAKDANSHLVAIVKVPEAAESDPEPWFIFNDFAVQNITEEEALSIPSNWKVPAILYLERIDLYPRLDFSGLPDKLDNTILCRDTNIAMSRDPRLIKHDSLRFDELPKPGTLIAIDAEFVSMQQEETEYRSDGTKKVIRPARLSLARVSVLRGDGPKEGVPFVDDHIHTSEIIVDYLTEFSGIKFGDLDPTLSRNTLTPLKVVYKKLRLLVDSGCIFIGHGLSKDFRIINIFVPPEQVIDTVDLYFLEKRQRRLSLRFLTWFVLKENIQTDTHDSIEDALSALKLYKIHLQLEAEGTFDNKLEELYREGRQYNFKPPGLPAAQSTTHASGSGTGSPMPHVAIGRGAFLPQQHFGGGGGHYPLNAVATPPLFPGPGSNHHSFAQQNWRNR